MQQSQQLPRTIMPNKGSSGGTTLLASRIFRQPTRKRPTGKRYSIKQFILVTLTVWSLLDTLETIARYQPLDLNYSAARESQAATTANFAARLLTGSTVDQSSKLHRTRQASGVEVTVSDIVVIGAGGVATAQASKNYDCHTSALINDTVLLNSLDQQLGQSHDCDNDTINTNRYNNQGGGTNDKPQESSWQLMRWHLKLTAKGPSGGWFSSIVKQATAIRLLRLEAPHSVQSGQPIRLRCLFETKGDKLQSLSWYKNGREFYRYQPSERRQPVLAFNLTGVNVDMTRSRNSTVVLTNTTIETSGRYKCEATGSTFQEVNMDTYVNVISVTSGAISTLMTKWISPHLLITLVLIDLLLFNSIL